jgi:hypothetical protein
MQNPITEHVVVNDVSLLRLELTRGQDNPAHVRKTLAEINRRLADAMPPLQAGLQMPNRSYPTE